MAVSGLTGRLARHAAWLVLAVTFSHAAPGQEVIERFDSVVNVRADGTLGVTETITVRAEGDRIRRGIYRDFPTTFRDAGGRIRNVTFELVDVSRDGRPEPHFTRSSDKGVRIYAGDEDVFLEPGSYTYRIRYETGRQLRFLEDHTELYWNVTGNEWAFPILTASAVIGLPGNAAPARWTAFTGRYGERGEDFRGRVQSDNRLAVTTTATLAAGEGLSVVVEIPPGLVTPPSGAQSLYYSFLDNRRYIFGGLGLVGLLVFYVATWNAVGRDPKKGTIIPLFHPPEGISPALAGYVHNWGWRGGWRNFTAAAIALATKKLMVFDDSGKDIVLRRTEKAMPLHAAPLPPGERVILSWVERKGGAVTIDKASGASLKSAFDDFKSKIEKENRNRFFRRNLGYFFLGLAVTAVTFGLILAFGGLSGSETFVLAAVAFAGAWLGIFLMPLIRVLAGRRGVRNVVSAGINVGIVIVIGTIFLSSISGALGALPDDFSNSLGEVVRDNALPFALIGGFAGLNGLFYYLLRAPTAAGRTIMDQIEGLEMYIRTAETERMNLIGAPDLNTEHFERLLPYAIALDAEKPWSEAFAAAFARAHPGEDVATSYRPHWHGGRSFGTHDLGRSVASAVSAAQSSFASALPAPQSSSSGFSGGGFSGGGGGGGGGGGW